MAIVIDNARRADPVRPGPRLLVQVECLSSGTYIPGQQTGMRPGVHEIKVHEEDLPHLESMLETQWEYVEQAKVFNDGAFREHLTRVSKQSPEDVDLFLSEQLMDKDAHTAINRAKYEYQGSWEAEFFEMMRRIEGKARGRRPLKSIKVLGPCEPELDPQQQGMVDLVSQLKGAIAPPAPDPALVATVAELKAEIDALKVKRTPKSRKGKAAEE